MAANAFTQGFQEIVDIFVGGDGFDEKESKYGSFKQLLNGQGQADFDDCPELLDLLHRSLGACRDVDFSFGADGNAGPELRRLDDVMTDAAVAADDYPDAGWDDDLLEQLDALVGMVADESKARGRASAASTGGPRPPMKQQSQSRPGTGNAQDELRSAMVRLQQLEVENETLRGKLAMQEDVAKALADERDNDEVLDAFASLNSRIDGELADLQRQVVDSATKAATLQQELKERANAGGATQRDAGDSERIRQIEERMARVQRGLEAAMNDDGTATPMIDDSQSDSGDDPALRSLKEMEVALRREISKRKQLEEQLKNGGGGGDDDSLAIRQDLEQAVMELEKEITARNDDVVALRVQIGAMQNDAKNVGEMERLRASVEIEKLRTELEWRCRTKDHEIARLNAKVESAEAKRNKVEAALRLSQMELTERRKEMEAIKIRVDSLMSKIEASSRDEGAKMKELAEVRHVVERLKAETEAQLRALDIKDQKIANSSAQADLDRAKSIRNAKVGSVPKGMTGKELMREFKASQQPATGAVAPATGRGAARGGAARGGARTRPGGR